MLLLMIALGSLLDNIKNAKIKLAFHLKFVSFFQLD